MQEDVNGEDVDPRTRRWQNELVNVVRNQWKSQELVGFVSDYNAIDSESDKSIERGIFKLAFGYVVIIIYSHIILFKNSPVFNKAHLAGFSVISGEHTL